MAPRPGPGMSSRVYAVHTSKVLGKRHCVPVLPAEQHGNRGHGRNLVGDTGTSPPTFSDGGDIICHVPPDFCSVDFVFGEVSKISDACHVVKSFSC